MNNVILMPAVVAQNNRNFDFSDAEDAVIIEDTLPEDSSISFLEANTNAISLEELTSTCVVPTWGNQELTISHQDFIHCVHDAAQRLLSWRASKQSCYPRFSYCKR